MVERLVEEPWDEDRIGMNALLHGKLALDRATPRRPQTRAFWPVAQGEPQSVIKPLDDTGVSQHGLAAGPPHRRPAEAPPGVGDLRAELAARYVAGEGLEIGARNWPLAVPDTARVRYVDRMSVAELRSEYPELASETLTPVDVVDDGEALATISNGSLDFIVANHFLEHCENPIATIETHLTKLAPGGVLYYAVPDKRFTFDVNRPVTPLDHIVRGY
jgi:SAM-dependent methyltransferase